MIKMSEIAMSVDDLQMVLDSEVVFQQSMLPELFDKNGNLNRIDLRRAVKSYVGTLLRQNWDVYAYLDAAISGTDEDQRMIINELATHWECKFQEGCYS